MKSPTQGSEIDEGRAEAHLAGVAQKVGSTAFKWALKGILGAVGAILAAGVLYLASQAASYNPDVVAAKTDVDVLKAQYKSLKVTADDHTVKLTQAADAWAQSAEAQKRNAELQGRIFEAIKGVGTDVHALDVKIATVNQKVDDLKEQVQRK